MRKVRGLIALAVAITLGFIAVKAVSFYLNKPAATPAKVVKKEKPKPKTDFDIPAGMRVVTIRVDDVSGVSRKMKKGDLVDVIATTPLPDAKEGRISRIILKKVKVQNVAAGNIEVAKRLVSQKKNWTVSLLLSPDNAAMLTSAAKGADITLMANKKNPPADEKNEPENGARFIFTQNQGIKKLSDLKGDHLESIPAGGRAVTIETDETDGICGVVKPGDHVDVLLSSKVAKIAGEDFSVGQQVDITKNALLTKMILQNVKVLATENSIKSDGDTNVPVQLVTLLVDNAQDAVLLTAASDTSRKMKIRLISRSLGDHASVNVKMVNSSNFFRALHYKPHKVVLYKGTKIKVKYF
ncbi:MAG: Flp pilus assembly protein CpaB [Desulfosarcina sp.]|nr:Flp pilus assembly protein CpaB [Desulfobacterales bacterium]